MNNTHRAVSKKCHIFYNNNNSVCIMHKYDLRASEPMRFLLQKHVLQEKLSRPV